MSNDNLISVIIPSKDRKISIKRAIESVRQQTAQNVQIVVVDDGSSDGTFEFIQNNLPEVIVIRNETSKGGAIARNQGAQMAEGDYIAFLDSDDEWLPNHLELMIAFLEKNDFEGAFSSFYISYDNGKSKVAPPFQPKYIGDNVLEYIIASGQGGDIRTSTMVFRKDAFEAVRFDERFKKYQDWDLAICFDEKYGLNCLQERTAVLHVSSGDRMSAKTHLEPTKLFLKKHHNYIEKKDLLNFYLKLAYKASIVENQKSETYRFAIKGAFKSLRDSLNLRNTINFLVLAFPYLNIPKIYFRFKRLINK